MNGSDWYWLGWATTTLIAFLVPELYALFTGHPDRKLSNAIWRLEDLLPYSLAWRLVFMGLIVWLGYHLTLGPRH